MKQLALSILGTAALTVGIAGLSAPSASAYVRTCASAAIPGCFSPDGFHTYTETRSSKGGAAASYICTGLSTTMATILSECASNTTFIRRCYYGGQLVQGAHWGSSSSWTVEGRDATASDANVC